MTRLDPRLHAFRPDLADEILRGRVAAERFTEGRSMQVAEPRLAVRREPRFDSMRTTEALLGETLRCFEEREGWAWIKLDRDGYVGYVPADGLTANIAAATHRVAVPLTLLYPAPDVKAQPVVEVPMNAALTVVAGDGKFAQTSAGRFAYLAHLRPAGSFAGDFVAVAEMFRHAPYCWGGKSFRGLDCSGLVQLALEACGAVAPRDTDMQQRELGRPLAENAIDRLRRGDLVFWKGHVGIMTDGENLLHANGHHMLTVVEPLCEPVRRIAAHGGPVTAIRRLQ
jgi:cell wall-associated NlpC family hydrolase